MSGNGDVAAGAHQNLRSDSFLSQMTDRLLVSGLPVVAFFILNGGAEPLAPPPPLTDLLYDAIKKQ